MKKAFETIKKSNYNLTAAMKKTQGFALAIVMVIIIVLSILTTLLISIVVSEYKISKSGESGTGAFYSASAGIEEAMWLVQNDASYINNLEQGTFTALNGDFSQDPALTDNSSYSVSIRSTGRGEADITATGQFSLGGQTSQRIVKTKIFKALNPNPVENIALFSDHDIDLTGIIMDVLGGGIFANDDIEVGIIPLIGYSNVDVEGDASAVDQIQVTWPSTLNAAALHSANNPPAPDPIDMPQIDFDHYKDIADNIYSQSEFENLLWNNRPLTINGITYVEMSPYEYIKLRGGHSLIVNGLLVLDGGLEVGSNWCWIKGWFQMHCSGNNDLTVNHTAGQPAGVLTKSKIKFNLWTDDVNVNGLLYGYDGVQMVSMPDNFNITGAIIGRSFFATSVWQGLNLTYDDTIIREALGTPKFAPAIQVEHWEEEY